MDNAIVLRFAERILAVLIGGICIYFGYRLFLAVPYSADSEGRFQLPWNTSIVLSRIGPGVFFALFGSVIVGSSLFRPITVGPSVGASSECGPSVNYARPESTDSDARADRWMLLQRDIAVLNTIPSELDPHLEPQDRNAINFAIPRIKLSLMELAWDPSWGSLAEFRRWVESHDERVPPGLEQAAKYFRYGTKAK